MERNVQNYFTRINYQKTPQIDLATLFELHRCHTLAIPFENIDPFTEQEVKIDLPSIIEKLVERKRGGYCFEQNLLFYNVLKSIGFNISLVAARVMIGVEESEVPKKTHFFSVVEIENEKYMVDVGFGSKTPGTPIKFILDEEQNVLNNRVRIKHLGPDYKLENFSSGKWKVLYRFNFDAVYESDCEVANFFVYAHPTSKFRNNLMISKILPEGLITLDNQNFSFYPYDGEIVKKSIATEEELEKFLTKEFELPEEVLSKKLLEKIGILD